MGNDDKNGRKEKHMQWNAFYYSICRRSIETYNVLEHKEKNIMDIRKKSNGDRSEFDRLLRAEMCYYYWAKSEWETVIGPWIGKETDVPKKVDVYWQLNLNWERFSDYCWECTEGS